MLRKSSPSIRCLYYDEIFVASTTNNNMKWKTKKQFGYLQFTAMRFQLRPKDNPGWWIRRKMMGDVSTICLHVYGNDLIGTSARLSKFSIWQEKCQPAWILFHKVKNVVSNSKLHKIRTVAHVRLGSKNASDGYWSLKIWFQNPWQANKYGGRLKKYLIYYCGIRISCF